MSNIDPSKPTYGKAYTASVRQNFLYAKQEIEELKSSLTSLVGDVSQGMFLPLTGGQLTGSLLLAYDPAAPTEAATKRYVDLLGSNIAANYLPLAGGTVTGNLTVGGTFTLTGAATFNSSVTLGSSTASSQRFLTLSAASGQNKTIQFQSNGLNRWLLRSDALGPDDLILQAFDDFGSGKGNLLLFDRANGAQYYTPYPTVISAADGGTPGLSMSYSMRSSYSGATTFNGGFIFNRWWVNSDTLTDQDQGIYYLFQGDYGPATTKGGRTGLQITLRSIGDLSSDNAIALNGFRSLVQGLHSGGATPAWNGGAVQSMDLMAQVVDGATGWGAVNIIQANNNISGVGQNNFIRRVGLYVACGLDLGTQGGRLDAVIATSINPVHNPTSYPAPGQGYRYYIGIGNGGSSSFTVDAYNGEIIGTLPSISIPNGQKVAMPTQSCLHGTNFSKINFVETAFWSPGFKVKGDGTTRIARLQVSPGSTGPIIDAPLQIATITAITSTTSGYASDAGAYVNEQCYDHLGGIAIVDSVDTNGSVLTAHYLQPPSVAAGEVITVASGVVAALATTGATVIHLRAGTYGGAPGDDIKTPYHVAGGIPPGATVVSFVSSQTDCVVTISSGLLGNLPVGTMVIITQTMPVSIVTFRTGSESTFSASVTWAPATTLSLGSSGVATTIVGPATLSNGGTLSGTFAGSPTFSGLPTFTGFAKFQNPTLSAAVITVGSNTVGNDIFINGAATNRRGINWQTAGLSRWRLFMDANDNLSLGSFDAQGGNFSGVLTIYANPSAPGASNSAFNFGNSSPLTLSGTGQTGYNFRHAYTGAITANLALWQSNIASDSIDAGNGRVVRGHYFGHSYGGGSASGGRIGLQVDFLQTGPLAFGSNAAIIVNATVNNPGGTDWVNLDSQLVGQNWNTELKQGALYFGVYKAQGEVDVSVDANVAVVTVGGGSPTGTTYSLTFTTTAPYQNTLTAPPPITTPVVITVVGVSGDNTMTIAAKLEAAIQFNDTLNQAGIGVSSGQYAGVIFTTNLTRAFALSYADWIGMTVVASATGGGGTLTVGAEVKGAGANQVKGTMYVTGGNHGVRGLLSTSVMTVQGSASTGSAGTFTNFLKVEGGPGGGGLWPLDPYCKFFQFIPGGVMNTANARVSQNQTRMATFVDASWVNFTQSSGYPLMFPGFRLDGTGAIRIGGNTLSRGPTGLIVDSSGWEGVATISNGGPGTTTAAYAIGDIGIDIYDGQYIVTAINTLGVITAMSILVAPCAPAGAMPPTANILIVGGSGSGWTVNIAWTARSTVSVGSSAARAMIASGSGAAAPTIAQLPAGMSSVWKNTTDASVRLYYNDGGTMRSVVMN